MKSDGLNSIEKKAAFSLATVFGLRMLGLFMILPIFAIYGTELEGYTPFWLGIAIGAYGLTQALLQIPMGILSDKFGRKPIIIIGLIVFLIGSLVAAHSETIHGVVFGRALQGMGAIASAVLALAADLSREEQRPKVMATIGMFIGLSFTVSMVLGPVVAQSYGLSGVFLFTGVLTLMAIFMVQFIVPSSQNKAPKGDNVAIPQQVSRLIVHPQLFRLNAGVFILHMVLTACFITLPKLFVAAGLPLEKHWALYLPTLFGSFFLMVPFMIYAIKSGREKAMFSAAVMLLTLTLVALALDASSLVALIVAMVAFFTAFNYLEATMPSQLSRIAPAGVKGSAMGIFTSSQFMGAFVGGALGGYVAQNFGEQTIFQVMALFAGLWFVLSLTMKQYQASKSFSFSTDKMDEEQGEQVLQKLIELPGVVEATLVYEECVAYVKLDVKKTSIEQVKAALKPQ
ncbi:MFS transporter [Thalassotalea sp. LPB0316]|uniref:MFS transporter n=1 Tax=Thalassotalea sp. LPB0316 TaxID=2769490 RepID=UPI001865D175|nr:MFS transporter [Thalassotalea sp. LPB0316]QOL26074.1 MFS transporter [Thalassotalea sp. LPB0316]